MGIELGQFDDEANEKRTSAEMPSLGVEYAVQDTSEFTKSEQGQEVNTPKRRGRPIGSKNVSKQDAAVIAAIADNPKPNPNPVAKRNPNNELFREEVFEHYWMQGLNGGERSFAATAKEFNLPSARVSGWFKKYHWQERIDSRATQIAKRMDERAVVKVAEIKTEYHNMLRDFIHAWFEVHFKDLNVKQLTLMTTDIDAVVKVMKMSMVLLNQPDAIRAIEGTVKHELDANLQKLSTDDLRAIVDARRKQKELPPVVTVEATPVAEEADSLLSTESPDEVSGVADVLKGS
jgi:hypothetical protein